MSLTFADLKSGGIKAAVEQQIVASSLNARSAEYAHQLAAGHKIPITTVSCVVDSFLHGDPSSHDDVLTHFAEIKAAFDAYSAALGTIGDLIASAPGTLERIPTGFRSDVSGNLQRKFT